VSTSILANPDTLLGQSIVKCNGDVVWTSDPEMATGEADELAQNEIEARWPGTKDRLRLKAAQSMSRVAQID